MLRFYEPNIEYNTPLAQDPNQLLPKPVTRQAPPAFIRHGLWVTGAIPGNGKVVQGASYGLSAKVITPKQVNAEIKQYGAGKVAPIPRATYAVNSAQPWTRATQINYTQG